MYLLSSFACAVALVSCASQMPGVRVERPEGLKLIGTVLLGPITIDESTLAVCGTAEGVAKNALLHKARSTTLFTLSEDDSLLASMRKRFPYGETDLAKAAARKGFDGVLLCEITAEFVEGGKKQETSLSIPSLTLSEDSVAYYVWGGAKATLRVIDVYSGAPVISSIMIHHLEDYELRLKGAQAMKAAETKVSGAVTRAFSQLAEEWDWATADGRSIAAPDSQK